jgi:ABC-type Fe3+/spermidine/putrescine transport system ATPase subunit
LSVPVKITGVAHRYAQRGPVVIHDLSLDVPAGGLTTVLGPSGSGKSTLLGLIAGIESPSAGDILFDGVSIVAVPAAKRGVALVLQQPHLFPYLSVGDNVTFGLAARGVRRATRVAEADRWLALVGLDGTAGRRPRELSGGEQQRVALVRALATEPRVLLLDEPLASLDPQVRVALQALLRDLVTETGVTSLMVTHDLSEAMSMGERTALLLDGHLIADEASERLFNRPPNRAAAEFVGISTFITGEVVGGHLQTPAGPLAVDGLVTNGRPALVAIRPEHVRLVDADGPNVIAGRAGPSTFRGEYWDCEVQTALGVLRARSAEPTKQDAVCRVDLPGKRLFAIAAAT